LAARLSPDPLGELKRSPRPLSRNKGGLLLRGGEGKIGERRVGEGRGGKGEGEGRGGGNLFQGVRGDRRPCLRLLDYALDIVVSQ